MNATTSNTTRTLIALPTIFMTVPPAKPKFEYLTKEHQRCFHLCCGSLVNKSRIHHRGTEIKISSLFTKSPISCFLAKFLSHNPTDVSRGIFQASLRKKDS